MTKPKIISIKLPEYTINKKPNYLKLGKKVDVEIEKSFPDDLYYERVLSMSDHPQLDIDEFIEIIISTGTDKYDPRRKAVCHDQFKIYDYDLQLGSFEIKNGQIQKHEDDKLPTLFGEAIYNFYENTPKDRGYKLRLDLMVLYNPDAFEQAKKYKQHRNKPNHQFDQFLYKFKDNFDKRKAVIGVVKILR